jgi:predicted phage baseplate assembly protein
VPDLYGRGPEERVYTTRLDEENRTTVQFGDGRSGARLPTGRENVRAAYRKGIGMDGLVRAEQLSLLMTPVLGVRGVKNPMAASGADDPESQEDARLNAPLTVLTLDRIVSLRDYEDFARAYAGIAKALATWVWTGETREVFVTVAAPEGREVGADLLQNLVGAIRAAGDRHLPLRVEGYRPAQFGMSARMRPDPDFIPERVVAAVEAALQELFRFEARSFGQGVALSEVHAAIQAVPGVVMVDVDELYRIPKDERLEQPQPFLEADVTRQGEEDGDVLPAELLTLDPLSLILEVIS